MADDNLIVPSGHGFATKADVRALAESVAASFGLGEEAVANGVLTAATGWTIDEQWFHRKGRDVLWRAVVTRTGASISVNADGWAGTQTVGQLNAEWMPITWTAFGGGYAQHRAVTGGAITPEGLVRFYGVGGSAQIDTSDKVGLSGLYRQ